MVRPPVYLVLLLPSVLSALSVFSFHCGFHLHHLRVALLLSHLSTLVGAKQTAAYAESPVPVSLGNSDVGIVEADDQIFDWRPDKRLVAHVAPCLGILLESMDVVEVVAVLVEGFVVAEEREELYTGVAFEQQQHFELANYSKWLYQRYQQLHSALQCPHQPLQDQ